MSRRTVVKKIKLLEPFPYAGEDLEEIEIFEPRGKTLKRVAKAAAREDGSELDVLIEDLTGLPDEITDELAFEDMFSLIAGTSEAFAGKTGAAMDHARSLGLTVLEGIVPSSDSFRPTGETSSESSRPSSDGPPTS